MQTIINIIFTILMLYGLLCASCIGLTFAAIARARWLNKRYRAKMAKDRLKVKR